MGNFGFPAVPAITAICYLLAQLVKATPLERKWLPVLCGAAGGALGIAAMLLTADPVAADPLSAIAVGIVSGFAATGVDQAHKQLTREEDDHAGD